LQEDPSIELGCPAPRRWTTSDCSVLQCGPCARGALREKRVQ
jgi:hypothetical protein